MAITFQINAMTVKYEDYYYVDDPNNPDAIEAPKHIQRYKVVHAGREKDPGTKVLGYAVSKYDLPNRKTKFYPFYAYTRLAERLGLPVDEDALERQWVQKFRRVYQVHRRAESDVTGKCSFWYYRDLIQWCQKQPMPPAYPQVLHILTKHYGGKNEMKAAFKYPCVDFAEKRKELQTKWDKFVANFKKYKEKYMRWFAAKPKRTMLVSELSDKILYFDGEHRWTKESIEFIERSQPIKSTIQLRHPITEEMVTVLDM